jgi:HD-GYP domain-containing protein (c-di-GMP phosphodiesterase class II)
MPSARPRIDSRFFRSVVGRRLLAIVSACALLPVAAFAWFSYQRVSHQLETDASEALHRASKAAGMSMLERLLLAEHALRQEAAVGLPAGTGWTVAPEVASMLGAVESFPPGSPLLAALSRRERAHLDQGRTLLIVDGAGALQRLLLAFEHGAPGEVVAAEVEPDYVFAGLLAGTDRATVVGDDGAVLFATPNVDDEHDPEAKVLAAEWQLFLLPSFGAETWTIRIARSADAVYRPLREFESIFPWIAGLAILSALGLTLYQMRRTLVPILALTEGAESIARRDYGARVSVTSRDELGRLSEVFNAMAETTGRHIQILATVNRIGAALSAERENAAVVDIVLAGSMQVTGAAAGALFLFEGVPVLARLSHASGKRLSRAAEEALPRRPVERCLASDGGARNVTVSSADPEEELSWRAFGAHLERPVTFHLSVPMRDEKRAELGALLLVRTTPEPFSEQEIALAESLASQATVAIRKNRLVESFRGLFEGLIQLTVGAIDEKSAYTGDHCRNVPLITEMIADAACADRNGPFKDFTLTEEQRYELRIAALLHDCGKVVTPVHVMDKATKLETILDRIALVETRFEVLRRDARLRSMARRLAATQLDGATDADAVLAAELRALDADLAFLRECNRGGEQMADSACDRVREIAAQRRWMPDTGEDRGALDPDEIENLTIRRGTLNPAEREIIRHHVVATTRMLEQLPFPPDLRNVPAIAGAHHERMDGTGYPRRLRADQLSVQARILGLADVFEALTARDRPYKPGMTLRQTLDILATMSAEGHIDRELLELFLRDRLHLHYAIAHMSPGQIDAEFQAEIEELTSP